MKKIIIVLSVILIQLSTFNVYNSKAQDIHFSQFGASPLTLNPAFTGVFSGDYRGTVNYKDQWNSFTTGYKTIATSVDGSFYRDKLSTRFIGAGLVLYSDKAGDAGFGTTSIQLSGSFNKSLDADNKHYISVGLQTGIIQLGFNLEDMTWDSQWDGNKYNANGATSSIPKNKILSLDISTGLLWYYIPNRQFSITSGLGLFHITKPNQAFLSANESLLYSKLTFYTGAEYALNDYMSVLPSFAYYKQGSNQEFIVGTFFKRIISRIIEGEPSYLLGIWYRNDDAIIAATRLDYRHYRIGLSYDINVSPLYTISNNKGGPELSITVIFPMPNKVKSSRVSCPGF